MPADKKSSEKLDVVEGEILEREGPPNSGSSKAKNPQNSRIKFYVYLGVVIALCAAIWWYFPSQVQKLFTVFSFFQTEQSQTVPTPTPNSEVAVVSIVDIEARLSELEGTIEGLGQNAQENNQELNQKHDDMMATHQVESQKLNHMLEVLSARLVQLEEKVAEIEARPVVGGGQATADGALGLAQQKQIATRIAALEAQLNGLNNEKPGNGAYIIAIVQLTKAVESGQPYAKALNNAKLIHSALTKRQPDVNDGYLAELEPWADKGVPDEKTIIQAFEAALPVALNADEMPTTGMWEGFTRKLKSLVRIRKTGETEGDSAEAVLARLEVRLNDLNYQGALEILGQTSLSENAALAPLMEMLDVRVKATHALSQLYNNLEQG